MLWIGLNKKEIFKNYNYRTFVFGITSISDINFFIVYGKNQIMASNSFTGFGT